MLFLFVCVTMMCSIVSAFVRGPSFLRSTRQNYIEMRRNVHIVERGDADRTREGIQWCVKIGSSISVGMGTGLCVASPSYALVDSIMIKPLRTLKSDEYTVQFDTNFFGLSLVETERSKGSCKVILSSLIEDGEAFRKRSNGTRIVDGSILVCIGQSVVEGDGLRRVAEALVNNPQRPLNITFRDPYAFFQLLNGSRPDNEIAKINTPVTTSVKGAVTADQAMKTGVVEEVLEICVKDRPSEDVRTRVADIGDVIEIVYSVRSEQGELLSGVEDVESTVEEIASNKGALSGTYFVLGNVLSSKLPLPLGFDFALRGMTIGECRKIVLPPCMLKNIPKMFATVESPPICTVKLVSINGETTL
jgi:hypothetical protein